MNSRQFRWIGISLALVLTLCAWSKGLSATPLYAYQINFVADNARGGDERFTFASHLESRGLQLGQNALVLATRCEDYDSTPEISSTDFSVRWSEQSGFQKFRNARQLFCSGTVFTTEPQADWRGGPVESLVLHAIMQSAEPFYIRPLEPQEWLDPKADQMELRLHPMVVAEIRQALARTGVVFFPGTVPATLKLSVEVFNWRAPIIVPPDLVSRLMGASSGRCADRL